MSEEMSSKEDIARAQRIKELEPLVEAWHQWNHLVQVRTTSNISGTTLICFVSSLEQM